MGRRSHPTYNILPGDVVRLGGYTHPRILEHNAKQPATAYWLKLNTGFSWRGTWLDDQEYYLGDTVRYGDNSYVCVQGHIFNEGDDGSSGDPDNTGGVSAANSRPDQDTTGTYWNVIAIGTEQSVQQPKVTWCTTVVVLL